MDLLELVCNNVKDINLYLHIRNVSKYHLNLSDHLFNTMKFNKTTFNLTNEICSCNRKKPRVEPFNLCITCSKNNMFTLCTSKALKKFNLEKCDLQNLDSFNTNNNHKFYYKKDLYIYSIIKYGPKDLFNILNKKNIISVAKSKRIEKVKKIGVIENSLKWKYCAEDFINSPTYNTFKSVLNRINNYDKFIVYYNNLDEKYKKELLRGLKYYTSNYYIRYNYITDIKQFIENCIEYIKFLEKIKETDRMFLPYMFRTIDIFFFGENKNLDYVKNYVIDYFKRLNFKDINYDELI